MTHEQTLSNPMAAAHAAVLIRLTLERPSGQVRTDDPGELEQARLAPLMTAIAQRDQRAFETFYDATAGRVYGLARRIARNDQAAEEIAGDVYLQAWRDAARYDAARSRVLTWLLMICRSRALDYLRALDPAMAHEDPETLRGEDDRPADRDPVDLLDAVQRETVLHAALNELSALQRQLLALAFFRGLTHEEIAAQARLPLGTVKSGIRRALEALREMLGDLDMPASLRKS